MTILTKNSMTRYAMECTNAWKPCLRQAEAVFRSLLNRFDTTVASWTGLNYLAFMALASKKFKPSKKKKV